MRGCSSRFANVWTNAPGERHPVGGADGDDG
jgi:hypothetical protein